MTLIFKAQAHNIPASPRPERGPCPQPRKGEGVEDAPQTSVLKYLRMFSYLLILCGAVGIAVGVAVAYSAVATTALSPADAPLGALMLAVAALVSNGLAVAVGILGRMASARRERLASFRTLALVDIVATVIGLGLCYVTGAGLPTSLIFNLLLMAMSVAIANNLRKTQN